MIGPRARRRLLRAGIGIALIAAVAIAVVVTTHSPGHPSTTTSAHGGRVIKGVTDGRPWTDTYGPKSDMRYAMNYQRITFGMTRQQMRKVVGPPEKTIGSCWQYRLDKTISSSGRTSTVNDERLCFSYGVYNTHYAQSDGIWRDDGGNPVPDPTK